MPSLLLEIGCEELPASACYEAERQLPRLCAEHFGAEPAELFIGPRRLAALLHDLPERTEPAWIKGPPEAMRERAAAGFARRHGVDPGELEVREGFLGIEQPGRALRDVLPESIDAVVRGLAFNRTMRWDDSGLRYPRPVRWVLAKLDEDTLQGAHSFGHRFTHGPVDIPAAGDYATRLRAAGVEPVAGARRRAILEGLPEGWSDPAGVLDEVVHLVEWPVVLESAFDARFLDLPRDVVIAAMQSHQRYFPLEGNRFAFVVERRRPGRRPRREHAGPGEPAGRRRLQLRARRQGGDRRTGRAPRRNLVLRRRRNVRRQGRAFAEARRTARWGRGDARGGAPRQGGPGLRARARVPGAGGAHRRRVRAPGWISRGSLRRPGAQYLPDAAGGPLPSTESGRVLSAADKIDTLTISFSLGHRPTGSRDPFGLRRAAIGLCRLATDGALAIPRALLEGEVARFRRGAVRGAPRPPRRVRPRRAPLRGHRTGPGRAARPGARTAGRRGARPPLHRLLAQRSAGRPLPGGGCARELPGLLREQTEVDLAREVGRLGPEIHERCRRGDIQGALRGRCRAR